MREFAIYIKKIRYLMLLYSTVSVISNKNCLMIEQSLQSHHTPISHIFKTLNPVESFSPLPLQYHITQLVFSAEYSYQST